MPLVESKATNLRFKFIFWYGVYITTFALSYIVAITFFEIPEKNVQFAQTTQGFLLGTIISGFVGYLIGASPEPPRPAQPPLHTTEVTQSISSTEPNTEVKE